MAVDQVALEGVVTILTVVHTGFDVLVGLGLAYVPHREAGEHGPDMAMLPIVGRLDGHSSSCHVPMAEELVHGIADANDNYPVMHHTAQ